MPDLSPPTSEATATTSAVHVRVSGRVQGVFFRDSLRALARRHGVTGWVRNDPEGTVTAVLEGGQAGLDELLAWIRKGGPPGASVDDVETRQVATEGHEGFRVRH